MRPSNSIIVLVAAACCGLLAGVWSGPRPDTAKVCENESPLGILGSPYGSMVARLMKSSMHNYWHAGRLEQHPGKTVPPRSSPNEGYGSPFEIDLNHQSESIVGATHKGSCLQQSIDWLMELEEARVTPTTMIAMSKAHRRYLDATANWQLKAAFRLDPGDAALYEVLHYTAMGSAARPDLARSEAEKLAAQTISHALSDQGGISAALTGAGAAINLLNNDMVRDSGVAPEVARQHWRMLSKCLQRYRVLKAQAVEEGWWEGVPQVRRGELAGYGALVEKLSNTIGRRLVATGVLTTQADGGL